MAKVYFKAIDSYAKTEEISYTGEKLLKKVIDEEKLQLEPSIPLKVHFGEKGNNTYIEAKNFDGIVAYLEKNKVESCFMETNAIYSGQRMTKEKHIQLAKEHHFTKLPVVIADGELGENYKEVEINKKHFQKCKIGSEIIKPKQMIVLSHFKGHMLAGFGGAIKQLGMGCSARGGKLEQHVDAKPFIIPFKCKKCNVCLKHCPVEAINTKGFFYKIDKGKCIGCAACIAVCPHKSVFVNIFKAQLSKKFREKIAEYAYAAQKDKTNIYLTFAFNITKGCDCEGRNMKLIAGDLGVFASIDPVSIDKACLDMLDKKENKSVFKGRETLDYAEEIGLGTKQYELIEIT